MKISTLNISEELISGEVEGLPSTNLGKRGADIRELRNLVHNELLAHATILKENKTLKAKGRPDRYTGCVSSQPGWIVTIHLRFPNDGDKDIDNQIKPILDGLTLPANPNQFVGLLSTLGSKKTDPLYSLLANDSQIIAILCTKSVVDSNPAGFSFTLKKQVDLVLCSPNPPSSLA
jgi:hypothetical protein